MPVSDKTGKTQYQLVLKLVFFNHVRAVNGFTKALLVYAVGNNGDIKFGYTDCDDFFGQHPCHWKDEVGLLPNIMFRPFRQSIQLYAIMLFTFLVKWRVDFE